MQRLVALLHAKSSIFSLLASGMFYVTSFSCPSLSKYLSQNHDWAQKDDVNWLYEKYLLQLGLQNMIYICSIKAVDRPKTDWIQCLCLLQTQVKATYNSLHWEVIYITSPIWTLKPELKTGMVRFLSLLFHVENN